MKNYKKIKFNDHIYYVSDQIYATYENESLGETGIFKHYGLMRFSDYVCNIKTNELVKNRYMIEDLIDAAILGLNSKELL